MAQRRQPRERLVHRDDERILASPHPGVLAEALAGIARHLERLQHGFGEDGLRSRRGSRRRGRRENLALDANGDVRVLATLVVRARARVIEQREVTLAGAAGSIVQVRFLPIGVAEKLVDEKRDVVREQGVVLVLAEDGAGDVLQEARGPELATGGATEGSSAQLRMARVALHVPCVGPVEGVWDSTPRARSAKNSPSVARRRSTKAPRPFVACSARRSLRRDDR